MYAHYKIYVLKILHNNKGGYIISSLRTKILDRDVKELAQVSQLVKAKARFQFS